MRSILFALSMCFVCLQSQAQEIPFPNHMLTPEYLRSNSLWVWANDFGMHFPDYNGVPVHKEVKMGGITPGGIYPFREGNTAICNPHTSEVLFYKDAVALRNRFNDVMLNGDSICGDGGSGTQGEIIVPMPGDSNLFIVFSMQDAESSVGNIEEELYYNIVDMRLDGGKGGVVEGKKNKVVYDFWGELVLGRLNEGIITIPGDSGNIWLIVHGGYNTLSGRGTRIDSNYYVFNITPELNAGVPTGDINIKGPGIYSGKVKQYVGRLKASPNRNWIFHHGTFNASDQGVVGPVAIGMGGQELVRFNPKTGEISHPVLLNLSPNLMENTVGAGDFSPDGNVLHFATMMGNFKYSLLNPDSIAIVNSVKFTIGDRFAMGGAPFYPAIKLYNQKIYIVSPGSNFVQAIENPNEYVGPTILNFNVVNLQLASRLEAWGGDPSFGVYGFKNFSEVVNRGLCEGDGSVLKPLYKVYDSTAPIWSDNSTSNTLAITQPGTYWVKYYRGLVNHYYAWQVDTFIVDNFSSIMPTIQVSTENPRLLSVAGIYKTYQWYLDGTKINGATSSTYLVSENGNYHVEVVDEFNCAFRSEIYKVTNQSGIQDLKEHGIYVYPNPVKDVLVINSQKKLQSNLKDLQGRVVMSKEFRTQIDMRVLPAGLYFLELEDLKSGARFVQKIVKE